jgi:nitrate reductase beta subunit
MCNHCSKPACLEACPVKAIYKREADGVVLINLDICVGAQQCIRGCPYAKIYFNSEMGKGNKCIACYPRIEQGVAPACVAQCAGRAMHVGYLEDKNSSVYKLVREWKVALPLHAEFGTEPNVFYVPPVLGPSQEDANGTPNNKPRIPLPYLEELFGKNVGSALQTLKTERAKRMKGVPSELMNLLLSQRNSQTQVLPAMAS